MKEIKGFDGEYSFLSNFYEKNILIPLKVYNYSAEELQDKFGYVVNNLTNISSEMKIIFPTAEHAFHAFKVFKNWERPTISELSEFLKFRFCSTPGKAKREGRKISLNVSYWDEVKNEVMKYILIQKFSDPELMQKLIDTGDAYLEETNTWHDTYWGVCDGVGQNNLGKILMSIRREILDAGNSTL